MALSCWGGAAGDVDHQGADEEAMLTSDVLLAWSAPPTRLSPSSRPAARASACAAIPDAPATAVDGTTTS